MKKISEHGAGFFKRRLSMLLIMVMLVSNFAVGSAAAPAPEDTAGTTTEEPAAADTAGTETPGDSTDSNGGASVDSDAQDQDADDSETTDGTTGGSTETPDTTPVDPDAPGNQPTDPTTGETGTPGDTTDPTVKPGDSGTGSTTEPTTPADPAAPTDPAVNPDDQQTEAPAEDVSGNEQQAKEPAAALALEEVPVPLTDSTTIEFDKYNRPLNIYNKLYYNGSGSSDVTLSNGSYVITGTNVDEEDGKTGQSIVIGNVDDETGDKAPLDENIFVSLKGLIMDASITVNQVGNNPAEPPTEDSLGVIMTVTADDEENPETSSIGELVVADNAKLTLIVDAPLTVGSITIGENSYVEFILNEDLTVKGAVTVAGEQSRLKVTKKEDASGSARLIVSDAITSDGTVSLEGGEIQAKGGLSAAHLSLKGTTVHAKDDAAGAKHGITATETLTMEDSTVSEASLFGYADGVTGEKSLILSGSGNTFGNVDAVGCLPESNIRLSLQGENTINSSGGVNYYCDYPITYDYSSDVTVDKKNPVEEWPVSYRIKSADKDFTKAVIQGYHKISGTAETPETPETPENPGTQDTQAFTYVPLNSTTEITLPVLSKDGYDYLGWKVNASEESVKTLAAMAGAVSLSVNLKAKEVTVNLDSGYDPDKYTNDPNEDGNLPERKSTLESAVDGTVTLPVPFRFGYNFKGWKITATDGKEETISYDGNASQYIYQVKWDHCVKDGDKYVVNMEAQWEEGKFGLVLYLGLPEITDDNLLMISLDGGTSYISLTKFKEDYIKDDEKIRMDGRNIVFSINQCPITYGQKISDYLRQNHFTSLPEGQLPILKDNRAAGTAQDFAGWSGAGGRINENTTFSYGEDGMLELGDEEKKLTEYQNDLLAKGIPINAAWGAMSYALTLPETMPAGWELTYTDSKGTVQTIKAGKPAGVIQVREKKPVTFITNAKSPKNFSLWGFTMTGTDPKKKLKPDPEEQLYNAADQYLTYMFTMPSANVTATYNDKDVWIDIAKSPIEFEENVKNNSRNLTGFWYADEIEELTPLFWGENKKLEGTKRDGITALDTGAYFYQWDFADSFCVTSKGEPVKIDGDLKEIAPTKNQLTLVNALTGGVYFKELDMTMRDAYLEKANGSLIGDVDCEITSDGPITFKTIGDLEEAKLRLADYANIIVDNNTKQAYATTLHFVGTDNTVGAIMPDTLRPNTNNQNTLNIMGDGKGESTLKLGSAFGNFDYKSIKEIKIDEYKKPKKADGTEREQFKYLIHSSNWSCAITNAEIHAPEKTLHVGNKSFSITGGSKVDLRSINAYNGASLYGASYLRIRENLLLGYIPLKLNDGSKVVIDGNLEMNYQHWNNGTDEKSYITDGNENNWLIVKGNRCDLTNFNWRSGTLICNALIFGRCGGISGGTVITNQILSQPVGFWKYDKNDGAYKYNYLGSYVEEAKDNEDNYPFTVYSQKSVGIDTYSFSGGKTYLLGHYKYSGNKYDSTVTAGDTDNPVKQFMDKVIDPTSGDLIANPSVDTDAVKKAVEESKLKNNECVVLGNSTYNTGTRSRSIDISGEAQIYAAGNITFFNDTTVSGGSVYCNGSFGTKGDLTIKDGTVKAQTVGNAYNLTTTLDDGTKRWRLTNIEGGTIEAPRIGAFEKSVSGKVEPRSTVTVSAANVVNKGTEIDHDVYINYICGSDFTNRAGNPESLRFHVEWDSAKGFGEQGWSNDETKFAPPEVSGENANWKWDSLTGSEVTSISDKGIPYNGNEALTNEKNAFDRIQMKLYAVKETYQLIFKRGADQIDSVNYVEPNLPAIQKPTKDEDTSTVTANKEIVLKLKSAEMAEKYTVLWYIDGTNIIHSVNGTVNGDTVTFTMPTCDVEVYATRDLELDLDIASYTLMQNGFRTESGETQERTDSEFRYLGNLTIHQGSIKNMEFDNTQIFVTSSRNTDPNKPTPTPIGNDTNEGTDFDLVSTRHNIRVEGDFNNSENGRTITLRHIFQAGESYSKGIYLKKGAKANFTLDGPVRICRVEVPAGADFTLSGKNDSTPDAFYPYVVGQETSSNRVSLGNFYGAAGNITLKDLTVLGRPNGMNGYFCYGKDTADGNTVKGENTVKFENCQYTTSKKWYSSSYLAYNAKEVIFDHSTFTIKQAEDWPAPFFEKCGNVTIQNGSEITVTDSGSTSATAKPFYYGISGELLIDNATVNLSMRKAEKNSYLMSQSVKGIAPVIQLTNGASLLLDQHARLNRLVIEDSTVSVGESGTGYLLCPDIEVNSGSLNAGGIIVSGFYDASHAVDNPDAELQKEENFTAAMKNGQYIFDGKDSNGLVVNDGTVTVKEYITGDVNGKITVNGGEVTAPVIGTTGMLYGYTRYVPMPDKNDKYIYTYKKIPEENAAAVTVFGGKVVVSDYLGGMHADVTISGGEVSLGEDAILGLTEEQKTTLTTDASSDGLKPSDFKNFGSLSITGGRVEGVRDADGKVTKGGSIQVPYGTVNVSGKDTGINVYDMTAESGDITISELNGDLYENPYKGTDGQHKKLNLVVNNRLAAQNLLIKDGAVVYADYAYAEVPKDETGNITVIVEKSGRADLYAGTSYGVTGEGQSSYDYNDGLGGNDPKDKNVYGTKTVNVTYVLRPEEGVFLKEDEYKTITNPNQEAADGLPDYVVLPSDTPKDDLNRYYTLQAPSCDGYEFLGWYQYDRTTKKLVGKEIKTLDKTVADDVYIGAKWKRAEVEFEIRIWIEDTQYNKDTMELIEPEQSTVDQDKTLYLYKFRKTVTIPYGDKILGGKGIVTTNFVTSTKTFSDVTYNNNTVKTEDIVTSDMAAEFLKNGKNPLILEVPKKSIYTVRAKITLNQNRKKRESNGKYYPEKTKFNLNLNVDPDKKIGISDADDTRDTVSIYVETKQNGKDNVLQNVLPFMKADSSDLITPTATGYTFGGWYTDADCTGSKVAPDITINALSKDDMATLYAKWTPNTYIVRFSAATGEKDSAFNSNQWVTVDDTEPAVNKDKNDALDYHWIYDTAPDEADMHGFWVIDENDARQYQTDLPSAWREGYVFDGWKVEGSNEVLTKEEILSADRLKNLVVENYEGKDGYDGTTPALTLYASYHPVTVTYDLNGGKWAKDPAPSNPKYGEALGGYIKKEDINTSIIEKTDYTKEGEDSDAYGREYYALSTTGGYFEKHNTTDDYRQAYVPGDYRGSLSYKGYTFKGWKNAEDESDTKYYGCTPRFKDIKVKAHWEANVYNLNVYLKDEEYDKYESKFGNSDKFTKTKIEIGRIKVGDEIAATDWPGREDWYAYNKDEESLSDKYRLLLGATFAGLDPGDSNNKDTGSVYLRYAEAVTNLLNSGAVLNNGDAFFLPEDETYTADLGNAVITKTKMSNVPDYPTDSKISMYGVYRERSLVFIEKYYTDGEYREKVMYSQPWNDPYTDYPYKAYPGDPKGNFNKLTKNPGGYALIGWYVGSEIIDQAREYPKNSEDFKKSIGTWTNNATLKGEYDINVYTAYVAQQNDKQSLIAGTDSTQATLSSSAVCALSDSLQPGTLSYRLTPAPGHDEDFKNLHLISIDEMEKHLYDSEWGGLLKDYTPNDTVAIEMVLTDGNGKEYPGKDGKPEELKMDGKVYDAPSGLTDVGKGWNITLRLYHSRMMSEERSYTFNIEYTFKKEGEEDVSGNTQTVNKLEGQRLTSTVTVKLAPSRYKVTYKSNFPEKPESTVIDEKNFTEGGKSYTPKDLVAYNGSVLEEADLPVATYVSESSAPGTTVANARWRGKGDWYLALEEMNLSSKPEYKIPYGGQLGGQETLASLGEYLKAAADKNDYGHITLYTTWEEDDTLDLYLEDGTIEIWKDQYKHYKTGKTLNPKWQGNYNILMDRYNNVGKGANPATTGNVLKLHDDLSGRKIYLGNLGITSNNSIELFSGTKAELFTAYGKERLSDKSKKVDVSEINIKNILIPSGSSLYLKTKDEKDKASAEGIRITGELNLKPAGGYAAIGGHDDKNGSIDLENLNISMELPDGSEASGIGSGKKGGSSIVLNNCNVTVTEKDGYKGAWIGGSGVDDVSVNKTTVQVGGSENAQDSRALDGKTVKVTDSTLGKKDKPLTAPIHAEHNLVITRSDVY